LGLGRQPYVLFFSGSFINSSPVGISTLFLNIPTEILLEELQENLRENIQNQLKNIKTIQIKSSEGTRSIEGTQRGLQKLQNEHKEIFF
jgi:hypothetical protein